MRFSTPLPIDDALPDLARALRERPNAVLVAPPGAGKTTRVPLALLDEPWVEARKLIVLEPRRLAARAAAQRMAATLGEEVGETVGLRGRLGSENSAKTRIEIVTEGVFARMILDDPALDGVAAVLFDEFHERSLDADTGLALALDAQAGLRDDLRILVMSATLDGARVAALLGAAPVIESLGRAFPVETRHVSRDPRARLDEEVGKLALRALAEESGSLLVFLPGQGDIARTAEFLRERARDPAIEIAPLYGAMDRGAQDRAVSPAPKGKRKVVLATSIAETSLTIEGVRVVIDSGLARAPRFEPDLGLTRLETVRVSRASADQRRGRAGRTEPGVAYRMWEEAATLSVAMPTPDPASTLSLAPYAPPEILSADLSGLVLDLAFWGEREPANLRWLDPPPAPAIAEGKALLRALGALGAQGAITPLGRAIRALPLPPRLAAMVTQAAKEGEAGLAAEVAAVLVERGIGGEGADVAARVERLRRDRSQRATDARRLAQGWARMAGGDRTEGAADHAGRMLALAFPDRIAKARGKPGEFLMANGRAAALEPHEALARAPFLAIAEIAGRAGAARILAAAALSDEDFAAVAAERIERRDELSFDKASASVRARRVERLGAITLSERTLSAAASEETPRVLAEGIAALGIARLPWSKAQLQFRDRVAFLRRAEGEAWPDLSDAALGATAADWLAPHLTGKTALSEIGADDLSAALDALLPWDMKRRLDAEAPTHFEAPTGTRAAVDYEAEAGPTISIRVQELYGFSTHPALAGGRVPLTLELLSPAHRPIQITRDLPGFWRGSWAAVKSEMKGRYPRHLWPDDPSAAQATRRAKPRGA